MLDELKSEDLLLGFFMEAHEQVFFFVHCYFASLPSQTVGRSPVPIWATTLTV